MPLSTAPRQRLERLTADPSRAACVTHVEHVPPRSGIATEWPSWVPEVVRERLAAHGIARPWQHQARAADLAFTGQSVVLSTGTASGKSLAYLLPLLAALLAPEPATALYLSPTKALAADQLRRVRALALPAVRAATYDGDTPPAERDWVRSRANLVLTNPDMLHRSLLPGHRRWATFFRSLRYVVIDECHGYRGVFGSHVALVVRRLRRIAAHYGADPTFLLASATVSAAAESAGRLTGLAVAEVTEDAAPRGETEFVLWEPGFLAGLRGEHGAPVRRGVIGETGQLLADLVIDRVRTVAFVRSRRGAEAVALSARRALSPVAPELADRVAAYRAGFLPEDRRLLEAALQDGSLLGLAATSALELGVDVSGLDAVILAGWPGTVSSLWQQAGRAGREHQGALAIFVARDDPLDTYLVHHPEAIFGRPVEATVLDPGNPYVLAPHLAAAAAELPLTDSDASLFGTGMAGVVDDMVRRGVLRRRPAGWYWTRRERPADATDIRGVGGPAIRIVEAPTGRVLGGMDSGSAHTSLHRGAVYLHQGQTYLVAELSLEDAVALVEPADPDYTTLARDLTDIVIADTLRTIRRSRAALHYGTVDVTNQVVGFMRRRLVTGEIVGDEPLDLPARQLRTKGVWWTVSDDLVERADIDIGAVPGAAHAAEHASIGLLPLFATCDRWDIGGVSTARHPDTGCTTVFVYDGAPGGAGFAERGYAAGVRWLTTTRDAIRSCECEAGCPSCVQSPKCGNGNAPLDKGAAVRLLDALLGELAHAGG